MPCRTIPSCIRMPTRVKRYLVAGACLLSSRSRLTLVRMSSMRSARRERLFPSFDNPHDGIRSRQQVLAAVWLLSVTGPSVCSNSGSSIQIISMTWIDLCFGLNLLFVRPCIRDNEAKALKNGPLGHVHRQVLSNETEMKILLYGLHNHANQIVV